MAPPLTQRSVLLIAPHPDDETLGAAIWMRRAGAQQVTIVHVTDGCPRNASFFRAAGFRSRKTYALARAKELRSALTHLSIGRKQCIPLHFIDQEVYFHIPRLVIRLKALVERLRPTLVLSPAYEGGHPDHDASALAVAAVRKLTSAEFTHYEYSLYHAGPNREMVTSHFIPVKTSRARVISLSAGERRIKKRMLACFKTQQSILTRFTTLDERLRRAPCYDFSRAPHKGPLLYEQWWNISGKQWRRFAKAALAALPK